MFTKKLTCDNFTNLIDASTVIQGNISFTGVFKIQGKMIGDFIKANAWLRDKSNSKEEYTLIIEKSGSVQVNNIECKNVIIKGKLLATDLIVHDTLRIHAGAEISNMTIVYKTLEIEPGALLHECKLVHSSFSEKENPQQK